MLTFSDRTDIVYDTGYLYLMGAYAGDESFTSNLLMPSLCVSFAFGNCMAMEYKNGAWRLLGAAPRGKNRILLRKALLCGTAAAAICLILFLCRMAGTASVLPMDGIVFPMQELSCCAGFPLRIPIAVFLLLAALSQAASLILASWGVLLLSGWRRDYVQALFFSGVLFILPLMLKLPSFAPAGWFSVYPLYAWTALLF